EADRLGHAAGALEDHGGFLADMEPSCPVDLVEQRSKALAEKLRQDVEERAIDQRLLCMAPDLAHRRIGELDGVIGSAKHRDERRGLHEEGVQEALLQL